MTRRRQRAERRGRLSELIAEAWLALKGYRVAARRYRSQFGEVDLVVRRGGLVCFVEVKMRQSLHAAREAVTQTARLRIERTAAAWLAGNDPESRLSVRFDLIAVAPFRFPLHIREAWRPDFAAGGR